MIEELLKKFIYVGFFITNQKPPNLINFSWVLEKQIQKDNSGRVYLFVEEDESGNKKILKIGKSSDKMGMKGTLGFYYTALSGTPSQSRYNLHYLINKKILEGKKIHAYVKFVESVECEVFGFTTSSKERIPLDITYTEKLHLDDYKKIYGKFPEWNFQENSEEIDHEIMNNFGLFIQNKKTKKIK